MSQRRTDKHRSKFDRSNEKHRCPFCPQEFVQKAVCYNKHIAKHIKQAENNLLNSNICGKCGKKLRTKMNAHSKLCKANIQRQSLVNTNRAVTVNVSDTDNNEVIDLPVAVVNDFVQQINEHYFDPDLNKTIPGAVNQDLKTWVDQLKKRSCYWILKHPAPKPKTQYLTKFRMSSIS